MAVITLGEAFALYCYVLRIPPHSPHIRFALDKFIAEEADSIKNILSDKEERKNTEPDFLDILARDYGFDEDTLKNELKKGN